MVELRGRAKRQYVADMFGRIADRYDLLNSVMTGGMHRNWRERAAQATAQGAAGAQPAWPALALDVATGTGDLALALARYQGIDHAVAVDFVPKMLVLAQAKARAKGLAGKTSLIVGDALALPFADASFACVTAGFSLRNMADLPRAVAEMVRVVRPGGRVTTLELTPLVGGTKAFLFRIYFHRMVPLLGRVIAGDKAAYTYLPQSVDSFLDADRLAALFRDLGLTGVGYVRLGFGTVALHWGNRPNC